MSGDARTLKKDSLCGQAFPSLPKQYSSAIWARVFPKIVVPQNGWFIMENPIKMDDLGVPSF